MDSLSQSETESKNNGSKSHFVDNYEEMNMIEDAENITDSSVPDRETWDKKNDFIISCIGFAVGLGNVWRFPYLCYKNGGGAFLIPYLIFVVTAGFPLFFLELSLGQFMKQGGIGIWNICPIMKGAGLSSTVIMFLCSCYYILVLTWALYYLFRSFTIKLPWASCDNSWNTLGCSTNATSLLYHIQANAENNSMVTSINETTSVAENVNSSQISSSVVEFWQREVLQITSGIDQPGYIRWELALCLLLAWLICYVCIFKGIRATGKIVYFTALFPYVMLICLFIRGLMLPGAGTGIEFYLKPNFTKLQEAQVWFDAGTQVCFSYCTGMGAMVALGSYNLYHNNCFKDSVILAIVNSGTSLLSGFVVFTFLGFMAHEQNVPIDKVAASGPGLVFIAYPKAATLMPLSPLWSSMFFFMILLVGLDSQFVMVEGFLTAITDQFPHYLRPRRALFTAVVCGTSFLIGLSMITQGGMYVFQIFEYYSASGMTILWMAFWECVTIAWIYGANRYYGNLEDMIGYRPRYMKYSWLFITPAMIMGIFIFTLVDYQPLKYNKTYEYPTWGIFLGWILALSSMICIPLGVVYQLIKTPGHTFMERFHKARVPIFQTHQAHLIEKKTGQNRYHLHDTLGDFVCGGIKPKSNENLPTFSLSSCLCNTYDRPPSPIDENYEQQDMVIAEKSDDLV